MWECHAAIAISGFGKGSSKLACGLSCCRHGTSAAHMQQGDDVPLEPNDFKACATVGLARNAQRSQGNPGTHCAAGRLRRVEEGDIQRLPREKSARTLGH